MEKQTFTTKLFEACSDDELRPVMMCVHFKNGFAYASDGHLVIKQSLTLHTIINPDALEGKSLHRDNYKAIMGFEKAECDDSGIACSDADGRVAFFEYFNLNGVSIPDFDAVLKPSGAKSIEFIGISPKHVEKIGKAMHLISGAVRFNFQGIDKIILIDEPGNDDQFAGLMPAIINDSLDFK